jgi:hypothetical protein
MPNGWTKVARKFWVTDLTEGDLKELSNVIEEKDVDIQIDPEASPNLEIKELVTVPEVNGVVSFAPVDEAPAAGTGNITVSVDSGTVKPPEPSLTGIVEEIEPLDPSHNQIDRQSVPVHSNLEISTQNPPNSESLPETVKRTKRTLRKLKKPKRVFSPFAEAVIMNDDTNLRSNLIRNIESVAFRMVRISGGVRVKFRSVKTDLKRELIAKIRKIVKKKSKKRSWDNPTMDSAKKREDWPQWQKAIAAEIDQLEVDEDVFEFVDKNKLPKGAKVIPSMFVLQIKRLPNGMLDKYKARLVALGNQQSKDQYADISSPTARTSSVKLLISLQAKGDCASCVVDVKGAYLKSHVKSSDGALYMRLPDGRIVRLKKYLYGLKQAGYEWYETLSLVMTANGYHRSDYDPSLYYRRVGNTYCLAAVHVDDFYCIASSDSEIHRLQEVLKKAFGSITVKEDSVLAYLGMLVSSNADGSCTITQPGYLQKILEKCGIDLSSTASTPFSDKWSSKPDDNEFVNKTEYLERIGMLNYLAVLSRSDILYAVSRCAQNCSKPTKLDMRKVSRIFYYLNGTKQHGITFKKGPVRLLGWVDASHNQYVTDGKGHFGYCFSLGKDDGVFYARSQKMKLVTPAGSTETEYVAMYEAATEIVFLRNLLCELGFEQKEPTVLYEDNQSAIHMVNGRGSFQKQKHINVKYHYTRSLIKKGILSVVYCPTKKMRADVLTKALNRKPFTECVRSLLNVV